MRRSRQRTTSFRTAQEVEKQILERPSLRFPTFPGTVSWNSALQVLASAPVGKNGEELTEADINAGACLTSGACFPCRRRFDLNRHGIFHLGTYVHARGVPKSTVPCVLPNGSEVPATVQRELRHAGDSQSGVLRARRACRVLRSCPGSSSWCRSGCGTTSRARDDMQANTTLHELGHNLDLWHGGGKPQFTKTANGLHVFVQPNCKPNHLSIMSYLFQATGVREADGVARRTPVGRGDRIDQRAGPLDGPLFMASPDAPYTSWYAPKAPGTLGTQFALEPATKHCDGTPLLPTDSCVRHRAPGS